MSAARRGRRFCAVCGRIVVAPTDAVEWWRARYVYCPPHSALADSDRADPLRNLDRTDGYLSESGAMQALPPSSASNPQRMGVPSGFDGGGEDASPARERGR